MNYIQNNPPDLKHFHSSRPYLKPIPERNHDTYWATPRLDPCSGQILFLP